MLAAEDFRASTPSGIPLACIDFGCLLDDLGCDEFSSDGFHDPYLTSQSAFPLPPSKVPRTDSSSIEHPLFHHFSSLSLAPEALRSDSQKSQTSASSTSSSLVPSPFSAAFLSSVHTDDTSVVDDEKPLPSHHMSSSSTSPDNAQPLSATNQSSRVSFSSHSGSDSPDRPSSSTTTTTVSLSSRSNSTPNTKSRTPRGRASSVGSKSRPKTPHPSRRANRPSLRNDKTLSFISTSSPALSASSSASSEIPKPNSRPRTLLEEEDNSRCSDGDEEQSRSYSQSLSSRSASALFSLLRPSLAGSSFRKSTNRKKQSILPSRDTFSSPQKRDPLQSSGKKPSTRSRSKAHRVLGIASDDEKFLDSLNSTAPIQRDHQEGAGLVSTVDFDCSEEDDSAAKESASFFANEDNNELRQKPSKDGIPSVNESMTTLKASAVIENTGTDNNWSTNFYRRGKGMLMNRRISRPLSTIAVGGGPQENNHSDNGKLSTKQYSSLFRSRSVLAMKKKPHDALTPDDGESSRRPASWSRAPRLSFPDVEKDFGEFKDDGAEFHTPPTSPPLDRNSAHSFPDSYEYGFKSADGNDAMWNDGNVGKPKVSTTGSRLEAVSEEHATGEEEAEESFPSKEIPAMDVQVEVPPPQRRRDLSSISFGTDSDSSQAPSVYRGHTRKVPSIANTINSSADEGIPVPARTTSLSSRRKAKKQGSENPLQISQCLEQTPSSPLYSQNRVPFAVV